LLAYWNTSEKCFGKETGYNSEAQNPKYETKSKSEIQSTKPINGSP